MTQGDELTIPVYAFNNLNQSINVKVSLVDADPALEVSFVD